MEREHHRTVADVHRGNGNKMLLNTVIIKTIVLPEPDLSVSFVDVDSDHDLDVPRGRSN